MGCGGLVVLLTWLVDLVVWLLICCFVICTVELAVMLVRRCFGVFTVLNLFVGGWVVYLGGIWVRWFGLMFRLFGLYLFCCCLP